MTSPHPGRPTPPWFRNGYLWASVLVATSVVAGIAAVGSFFYGIGTAIDDYDEYYNDYEDYGYYVDQPAVLDAVAEPCVDMMVAGQEVSPLKTDPEQLVASLRGFAAAGQDIVTAIESADPDADSRLWRDDWVELVSSIEAYADEVEQFGDSATYYPPTSFDDIPLTERMAYASDVECELSFGVTTLGDPVD